MFASAHSYISEPFPWTQRSHVSQCIRSWVHFYEATDSTISASSTNHSTTLSFSAKCTEAVIADVNHSWLSSLTPNVPFYYGCSIWRNLCRLSAFSPSNLAENAVSLFNCWNTPPSAAVFPLEITPKTPQTKAGDFLPKGSTLWPGHHTSKVESRNNFALTWYLISPIWQLSSDLEGA